MKNRNLILSLILTLLFTLLFSPSSYTFAREERKNLPAFNFKESSSEENREKFENFNTLSIKEKIDFFKGLSNEDKEKIFRSVNNADKILLFNSLSEIEKKEWLRKYPGLELFITPEEITPLPTEKPIEALKEVPAPSDIEKIMSGKFPTDITRELRQFGYDFFKKEISTFAPVSTLPVGPDYIIGPGDSFTIHLWGKTENTYSATVTRDGSITLPRLGTLNVSGLTFAELKRYLLHKFKEYYPDFEMSITMGSLRTVEIFIVGEATNPGTYSLSSLSTLVTALFSVGGPTKNGSLRNIKLFRNGDLSSTIDLYEFLIRGTKGNDVRLQPGDTIFIPVLGPVVGIAGLIKRPAIYEMKGEQTIGDMIELAGGVLPVGYLQNVVVERITEHKRRVIKSFNLDPSYEKTNENLKIPLKDGDVIKIYPVHQRLRHVVYLEGHVKYPREYEWKPDMRLRDIIPSYDYLLPEPYLPQAEIIRLMPPDLHPEMIGFNLGALLAGDDAQNLLLKDQDRIIIYDKWEKRDLPEITIKGAVRKPGTYRLYSGMTIRDLIFRAGNLTDKAYLETATLGRVVKVEGGTETLILDFSPKKAISGMIEANLVLEKDDVIYIREFPEYREALQRKVFLEGEFLFPGEYTFSEGERISSIIEKAGGLTEDAYPFGALFLRESAKRVQKERLIEYVDKLEQDIMSLSAVAAGKALSEEEAAILQRTLETKAEMIKKFKSAEPTGRMVITLDEILLLPSSKYNFKLQPGDRLIVNKKPAYVNVMGAVYNPTALFAEEKKSVKHYLNLVGGTTKNADKKEIYIVKSNGTVISKGQGGLFGLGSWDNKKQRWTLGGFDSTTLDPGDTVIVPQKIETYAWMRFIKDTSQILYQLAVTVGVLKSSLNLF